MAELVNSNTADFAGKTIRLGLDISLLRYEEAGKPWWDGIVGIIVLVVLLVTKRKNKKD